MSSVRIRTERLLAEIAVVIRVWCVGGHGVAGVALVISTSIFD
jgi:hypothetical protein